MHVGFNCTSRRTQQLIFVCHHPYKEAQTSRIVVCDTVNLLPAASQQLLLIDITVQIGFRLQLHSLHILP